VPVAITGTPASHRLNADLPQPSALGSRFLAGLRHDGDASNAAQPLAHAVDVAGEVHCSATAPRTLRSRGRRVVSGRRRVVVLAGDD